MSFLWDWLQQEQIGDAQARVSAARFDAKAALAQIEQLEQRVDRLALLCQAMFEEMQRTAGFSESRLKERILEIDLRDGKRDGRLAPSVGNKCPDCGHVVTKARSNCFWCGAKLTWVT
jgi:hypothetical protein